MNKAQKLLERIDTIQIAMVDMEPDEFENVKKAVMGAVDKVMGKGNSTVIEPDAMASMLGQSKAESLLAKIDESSYEEEFNDMYPEKYDKLEKAIKQAFKRNKTNAIDVKITADGVQAEGKITIVLDPATVRSGGSLDELYYTMFYPILNKKVSKSAIVKKEFRGFQPDTFTDDATKGAMIVVEYSWDYKSTYNYAQKSQWRGLLKAAAKIKDYELSDAVSDIMMSAEQNADDTHYKKGDEEEGYWSTALGSLGVLMDDYSDDVGKWFTKQKYTW